MAASHRRVVRAKAAASNSHLFGQLVERQSPYNRRRTWSQLYSAEKEESSEETEATSSSQSNDVTPKEDDEEEKFGVLRTVLLAGPLFIKFTIVLL